MPLCLFTILYTPGSIIGEAVWTDVDNNEHILQSGPIQGHNFTFFEMPQLVVVVSCVDPQLHLCSVLHKKCHLLVKNDTKRITYITASAIKVNIMARKGHIYAVILSIRPNTPATGTCADDRRGIRDLAGQSKKCS